MRTWPALEVGRLMRVAPDGTERLLAALVDYQVAAISESTPDAWQVFFDSPGERDRAAEALAAAGIDAVRRPETLSMADLARLAASLASAG